MSERMIRGRKYAYTLYLDSHIHAHYLFYINRNEQIVLNQFGKNLSEETLDKIISNDFFERIPNLKRGVREDDTQIYKGRMYMYLLIC